jgi:uncharacterized membrane protein
MTPNGLWERLVAVDLVAGPMPSAGACSSPWYVSAMVAVAAWIASIFLLVSLGIALAGVLRSANGALVTGALICAASAAVMRMWRDKLFAQQFAVAASLAGQALLAYGILDAHWRSPGGWLTFALVEAALVAASPVYVHRVLSTIATAYAVRFALAHAGLGVMFAPLIAGAFVAAWSCVRTRPLEGALWRPVMAGVALVGLLFVPASLVDMFAWQVRTRSVGAVELAWFATAILAGALLVVIRGILRDTGVDLRSRTAWIAFAAGAGIALAAQPVPGLVVALVVLLVAFHEGSRTLMALAIVGMIGALVHHYYALDATLLAKSGALLATGVVVLVAAAAVRYGLADAETRHA